MKLLLDQNLSYRLVDRLADLFPGSTHARLVGLDRASDGALWEYAARHRYAVATRDVDLADMAAVNGAPPLVVWLRIGNSSTAAVEAAIRARHRDIMSAATNGVDCIEIW